MARRGDSVEYLYAEAQCVETDHAFRTLGINKKYQESLDEAESPLRPYLRQNARLVFTLVEETFFDPMSGLTFGSDDEKVDVALDKDNSNGVSGRHFSVSHIWAKDPEPLLLVLRNDSTKGLLVGNRKLESRQTMILPPGLINIRAGPAFLTLQVRDRQSILDSAAFMANWLHFQGAVDAAVPRLSRLAAATSRFDPTPDVLPELPSQDTVSARPSKPQRETRDAREEVRHVINRINRGQAYWRAHTAADHRFE
ncbi:Hypothetical protein D9617_48g089360 [Elsinoe fawcettii]|nr:Hypothetical protein D9617_48g089360 [Elsinoe fawcettii]